MKYKIVGIYYTKPIVITRSEGIALATRYGIYVNIGKPIDCNGLGPKIVNSITYNKSNDWFEITFAKGGLITIPRLKDTEVLYEEIKDNGDIQNKTK